jgi:hypothetical protein
MQEIGSGLTLVGTGIGQAAASITAAIDRVASAPRPAVQAGAAPALATPTARDVGPGLRPGAPVRAAGPRTRGSEPATMRDPAQQAAAGAPVDEAGSAALGRAERTLLATLVQFPEGLSKVRLSLLSGYSHKSSSFANALGALRTAGFVDRAGEPIRATAAGQSFLPDAPVMNRAEALQALRSRLGRAERVFLDACLANPDGLTKESLAEISGYSITSSSFANALGRLRSLELIDGFRVNPELLP